MTVKQVSVTYDRKLNLGNFQSANVGVTLWADLDEDDIASSATQSLQILARNLVREEASRLVPSLKTRTGIEE